MPPECTNTSVCSIPASPRDIDQNRAGTLVYQLATILAILLFLISF
jgi:hypothetical protein